MGQFGKKYNQKKKCWQMTRNAKTAKSLASQLLVLIPLVGGIAREIAKAVLLARLEAKGFCKDDIAWAKKNI